MCLKSVEDIQEHCMECPSTKVNTFKITTEFKKWKWAKAGPQAISTLSDYIQVNQDTRLWAVPIIPCKTTVVCGNTKIFLIKTRPKPAGLDRQAWVRFWGVLNDSAWLWLRWGVPSQSALGGGGGAGKIQNVTHNFLSFTGVPVVEKLVHFGGW